jgi:hypothetical protein
MRRASRVLGCALLSLLAAAGGGARQRGAGGAESRLTGVYRINIAESDRLYTVVEGASADLPFGEQQRFFIDLAVRLTPPDLIAIERRGRRVTIGSSRSPRVTLVADGVGRNERADDGRAVYSRTALEGERLVFTSRGRAEDNFSVIFAPVDDGRRLRVTRRLTAEGLREPVIIQTVYDKISDAARWDIYGEPLLARDDTRRAGARERRDAADAPPRPAVPAGVEAAAGALTAALADWISATNARDLARQMDFYGARLEAFYLRRNVTRDFVRAEKQRAFATADLIDIRAAAPEIIFRDGGRTAVMRFRKQYRIEDGRRSRRGEVVQELRWRNTATGWKITSERDIRVIR